MRKILTLCITLLMVSALTSSTFALEKAVYRDPDYWLSWMNAEIADRLTDYLKGKGYQVLDAQGLRRFMLDRIQDRKPSVVVMANDVVPDTVAELDEKNLMGSGEDWAVPWNTFVRYLNHGGKVVYLADWPGYYVGQPAGARTPGADTRAARVLGNVWITRWGYHDTWETVTFTDAGKEWGLTKPWASTRGTAPADVDVILATVRGGTIAAGRVKYYTLGRRGIGLIYIYDRPIGATDMDEADFAQIQRVAEYYPDENIPLTATITGTVKLPTGPVVGGAVTILGPGGKVTVPTNDKGEFSLALAPGNYLVSYQVVGLEPYFEAVTVKEGETKTLSIDLKPLRTLDLGTEAGIATWKWAPAGSTMPNLDPVKPDFNDASWQDAQVPTDLGPELEDDSWFWYRAKFSLPADWPVDKPAILHSYNVDDSDATWVNGVLLGNLDWQWNVNRTYIIPPGVLKPGTNVITILGFDGAGGAGFNLMDRTPKLSVASERTGHIRGQVKVADLFNATVRGGNTVEIVNDDNPAIRSSFALQNRGIFNFVDLPPGNYTLTFKGSLFDGTITRKVKVEAGKVAEVTDVQPLPALLLATRFLPANITWRATDQGDPSNLKPADPKFDDSGWQKVIVPLRLEDDRNGAFGDNYWGWYRLKFTIPADWPKDRWLNLTNFNVDDSDLGFFNGHPLQSYHFFWNANRSYLIPPEWVNFGGENTLAILFQEGGGDSGISFRDLEVRINPFNKDFVPPPIAFIEKPDPDPRDDKFPGTTLDPKWQAKDIGDTSGGEHKVSNGVLTISADGADIWGNADAFHYVYQKVSGDFAAVVKVLSVPDTDPWSKAGIMIRAKDTPDSAHAFVCATGENGVRLQYRPADGGASADANAGIKILPQWIKIRRIGTRIEAYRSDDNGQTGALVASAEVPGLASKDLLLGLAVTSHSAGTVGTASFSDFKVWTIEAVAPPPPAAICGDANGDGRVAINDAILALQIAVGTRKATDAQIAALDLNGDGRVAIAEVILVLRKAVNPAFALTGKNCK